MIVKCFYSRLTNILTLTATALILIGCGVKEDDSTQVTENNTSAQPENGLMNNTQESNINSNSEEKSLDTSELESENFVLTLPEVTDAYSKYAKGQISQGELEKIYNDVESKGTSKKHKWEHFTTTEDKTKYYLASVGESYNGTKYHWVMSSKDDSSFKYLNKVNYEDKTVEILAGISFKQPNGKGKSPSGMVRQSIKESINPEDNTLLSEVYKKNCLM